MAKAHVEMPEFLADPFGSLERARSTGWLADFGITLGVVRYDEVRTLLTDSRLHANFTDFLRSFGITSGPFYEWMAISPLNKDGAEHLRWRALMSRAFTPRSVERIRPFLRQAAHDLIDAFAERGRCEFVAEFADAYPSLGLCELIGVPAEDRDRFRGWANTIGIGFSPLELAARIGEVDEALARLLAYTGALAEARRVEPRDDLVTRIAQAASEDGWSTEEVRGFIAGLVFAGHETTKNQLGWMVAALSEHPDVWDAVAADAAAVTDVVEEVLRFRSTVTGVGRTTAEPVAHEGERLEQGTPVILSLWGADHDGAVYPKPETFDVAAHRDTPHVAFGYGAHHCLGAALARAELQEALAVLTSRITCPTVGADAAWKPGVGITGPLRLPITFGAREKHDESSAP
jgi:cytochrome P450